MTKIDPVRCAAMRAAGVSSKEIAAEFGVKYPAVNRMLRVASGRQRPRCPPSPPSDPALVERISDMLRDCHTVEYIAETVGVSRERIRAVRDIMGIPVCKRRPATASDGQRRPATASRQTFARSVSGPREEPPESQYVRRDPCFKCGVRADIGCGCGE